MQKSENNFNLIDWWKKVVFENYANFSGRARRSEYWYFVLGQFCLIIPFYILAFAGAMNQSEGMLYVGSAVYLLVIIGTIIPGLAVAVRRLHDTGKSGWYYFIALIPIIGSILLLVWFCTEGNRFQNQWGSDPKDPEGGLQFDFDQTHSV